MPIQSNWQNASQYRFLPEHWLSRILGKLASGNYGVATQCAIKKFSSYYKVDMTDAVRSEFNQYKSFNDFFTRTLKPEARPISKDPATLSCPVDGKIFNVGKLEKDIHLEAKKTRFTLSALLGGDTNLAEQFTGGNYATLYLSPKDYHRIHMPLTGSLEKMIYIPGRLFPVKPKVVEKTPHLFARNERVICLFETKMGRMAIILVGAMIVGSIKTTWHGIVKADDLSQPTIWTYENNEITLRRGEEMGAFLLGSTVILLFQPNTITLNNNLSPDHPLKMGEVMARMTDL
ncbi:MAG: phosphatidylserine decarboxylase [Coxiella sp. RIFCSPHIGHO2_12_FULL_44_14]|nr:MAG: phosphatidylserine decarboxylase [Coxiella sp. RIFCSPHIGHO2_12_FULL_44_14]